MKNFKVENWLSRKGKKAVMITKSELTVASGTIKGMCDYLGIDHKVLTDNIEEDSNYLILIFDRKGICKELLQSSSSVLIEGYKEDNPKIHVLEIEVKYFK